MVTDVSFCQSFPSTFAETLRSVSRLSVGENIFPDFQFYSVFCNYIPIFSFRAIDVKQNAAQEATHGFLFNSI